MPDINAWLNDTQPIDAGARAVDAWRRISDKPSEVTLVRGGSVMAAQTVRLEVNRTSTTSAEAKGPAGKSSRQFAVIFGIRDHPTLPDTDIRRDDRFRYPNEDGQPQWRVNDVTYTLGEVQAFAEVQT